MSSRWSRIAVGTGLALAVAAALALWDSRFHVVPLVTGATWRGVSDPPTTARLLLALACGAVAGVGLSRTPAVGRPLLALGLAAAALIPIATGALLPMLAFQGPVLILVTGAALAVAFARAQRSGAPGRVPGWLWFAAPFVFYVTLAGRIPGAAGPQGDEPHYLALAHSLWTDGDLDLTDEFADREYAAFFPGSLEPHPSPSSPPGRLYSLHSPGLALIILPGYALGGFLGVQVELAAMAALLAWIVHRMVRDACGDAAAALAWGIVAFTPPLPVFAVSVYPELPAALGTAVVLRVCQGRRPHPASTLSAAFLCGVQPWLHSKFLPLGGLGLLFLILRPMARRIQIAAVVTFAGTLLALLALFDRLYGQATLSAAFGPPDISFTRLPWGAAAMFLDRQFGLLPWSPAWLLALVGWPMLLRERPGDAVRSAALAAVPIAVGGTFVTWWGGASPPARFILPALPAFALALAPAARLRPYLAAGLGGLGLALLGFAADAPRVLHNRTDGESLLLRNLNPSLDLNSFFPSFFDRGLGTLVLAVSIVAAAALFWRFRTRGAFVGLAGWLLVAGAVRTRPLVDPRLAVEDVLDAWEPANWAGPAGPPRLQSLAFTFELQKGRWVLRPGEARNSRRVTLYPGDYRVEARARTAGSGGFAMRVVLGTPDMDLAAAVLTDAQPSVVWPLLLPAGARGLGLNATAASGTAELEEVRIVPMALVPRGERGRYAWPTFARGDRHRVGGPVVRVTALDRSAPGDGGFRIAASGDRFLVDGPPAGAALVRVRPAPGATSVALVWGDRRLDLSGAPGEQAVRVPLSAGRDLGRTAVVPVSLVAPPGTWVGFFGTTDAP